MAAPKASSQAETLKTHLQDRFWRLNHLYWILTEQGDKIQFKLNAVQMLLYKALWWLNIIPKSRQHGITTFISIFMLDACLFNSDIRCGIIAHKLKDAIKIFREKVKYAYTHLPDDLKAAITLVKDDAQELIFSNNSGIYVGTSMRSGTLQYLHVSEYGWICTHAASKAAEVKTGAMETIHDKGMIFIESTGEGPEGDFPDMCRAAESLRQSGRELGTMDWKIHFFGWHEKPGNTTDPAFVDVSEDDNIYFDKLESIYSKTITPEQRAWYVAKKRTLKHLIFKEHPSTFEEMLIASVEGAYYAQEMAEMREHGRITSVPHNPRYPVYTVCDLGVGSNMPWIFFQKIGLETHIINCYNLSKKDDVRGGAVFYKGMLDDMRAEYKYNYGKYFAPFDANKGECGTGEAIYETFKKHGIKFTRLPREMSVLNGIERMTNMFPLLWIDSELCKPLILAWQSYRREWLENVGMFTPQPVPRQPASHYADAGRYLSMIIEKNMCQTDDSGVTMAEISQWNRQYRRVI